MEKQEKGIKEYYSIDIVQICKSSLHIWWIIALSGIIAAGISFSVSAFAIKTEYSSSIMLYVNNSSFSLGNTSFSISS